LKHVAMLLPTIDRIGGAESQVLLLVRGLSVRGWRVSLVTLSGDGRDAAKDLTTDGIRHFSLKTRKGLTDPRGWLRFQWWLRDQQPSIIHAHLPHAAWFARWSRLLYSGSAVVDTIHTSSTGTLGRQYGYRLSDRFADLVTAVSESCADAYIKKGLVKPQHLRVIPNGIDIEAWSPDPGAQSAIRSELGITGEFLWLAAGRLEPVKDYPTLLHALALLDDPVHLAIAGTGDCDSALRALARQLKIESHVTFLGFQQDMKRWMHAADGFVQASLWEGLPMAALEAAACGVPTVATDVPGTRDVVRPNVSGLLTPAGDAAALADAMRSIMRLPQDDRAEMGRLARKHVAGHFSLNHVLDLWESTYAELLR